MIFLPKSTNFKEIIYNLALVLLHNPLWSMALSFVIIFIRYNIDSWIRGGEQERGNGELYVCNSFLLLPPVAAY